MTAILATSPTYIMNNHDLPKVTLSMGSLSHHRSYKNSLAGLPLCSRAPFVEILWDNYCHLTPLEMGRLFPVIPDNGVAFHIMHSRFLERDDVFFRHFLANLKNHIASVPPLYVSDHIACFTNHGVQLLAPFEYNYKINDLLLTRIRKYQDTIDAPLLLENYASTDPVGERQVDFFSDLAHHTDCRVLFDVSNAVVAHLNGILDFSVWIDFLRGTSVHCHVGGFDRSSTTGLYHDTHRSPLSQVTLQAISSLRRECNIISICLERDYNFSEDSVIKDLKNIERALNLSKVEKIFSWKMPTSNQRSKKNTETLTRLTEIALTRAYLLPADGSFEQVTSGEQLPKVWHAPSAFLKSSSLSAIREKTIRRHGDLWLRNYDLSQHNRLHIFNQRNGSSFYFMRSSSPDDSPTIIGPLWEHPSLHLLEHLAHEIYFREFTI